MLSSYTKTPSLCKNCLLLWQFEEGSDSLLYYQENVAEDTNCMSWEEKKKKSGKWKKKIG